MALLSAGDELLMPWPSYPLYPLMAAHAYARPVAVDRAACSTRSHERTRAVVICNPNDPTGDHVTRDELGDLLSGAARHVHVLLDEALVHFQDVEPVDACLRLVDAFPRLLVVRTFSKVYGLSGLRAGYAVSLRRQAAGRNRARARGQRAEPGCRGARVAHGRRRDRAPPRVRGARARAPARRPERLAIDAAPSQANFIWLAADGISGALLAQRLRDQGVIVAPGGPLGADDHVRATVRDQAATDRLVRALEVALG